jgi:diguanylate cyclase (GGDEF)-like protein/PAS domain S-box-containing protein
VSGILVVERSATLNHLLQRTLQASQVGSWAELTSYADTLDHLQRAADMGQPYGLIMLGAPARSTRDFEDLLMFLRNPRQAKIPLLLLAHEKTADIDTFVAARPETTFLLWANFSRIPAIIRQLAPTPEPAAAEAPGREPTMSGTPMTHTDSAHKPANGVRLLFVDDSASVRLAYKQLLDRNGYQTETAGSISEGYQKAIAQHFDLMVIDYFLPDGNGDELCRKLRHNPATAGAAIAIITGTYREDVIKRCLEAGAVECTFKNEAKELFLARINGLARQVQMQKASHSEKQRLEGILGSVGDGVFGVDANGVISFVNPTALRLLGHDDEQALIGQSAHAMVHHSAGDGQPMDERESPLTRAYRSGDPLNALETVFWNRKREVMPVECSVLPLSVGAQREGSVVVFRDISERKSADALRWELIHDSLTGLYNARHFSLMLTSELNKRRENGGYSAVLYVDIDRYTHIIDAGGPAAGDRLVADIGQAFNKRLREGDVMARLEGDRMALLLTGVALDNLFTIADGFRALAHECHYIANKHKRSATVSLGVAVLSRDTPSAEYALEHARVACKTAKHRGRDQTQIYVGEHDVRVARELEAGWTSRFREAIEQNRFEFDLQPIVPLSALATDEARIESRNGWRLGNPSSEILFELLIRMRDRRGDVVAPSVFVPLAERVGMMPKIDLWVVQHALAAMTEHAALLDRIAFSINLSNQTLADPESMVLILNAIKASGVPARALVFEITETSEMTSMHVVRRVMQQLRDLGCRFALDDFGTGFSSFTHLRHLPVDFVKIEGSFVEGMADNDLDHTMVASIAGLARSMKLSVIGEHVDSFATLQALRECGAAYAQGHYIGEPRKFVDLDFASVLPPR